MITILITQNTPGPSGGKSGAALSRKENPGTLLLREGLRAMGMHNFADHFTPDMLGRTQDGKPFFPGLSDIHFNLSHSGKYIACAFSDAAVGLDLQEHGRTDTDLLRIAKRFFTAAEYEAVLALPAEENAAVPGNSAFRQPLFYRLWSIKEAYLKYLGCGLRGGMDGYLPAPLPYTGSENNSPEKKLPRGQIRILCDDPRLTPAEYAVTEAPEDYTMVVCAGILPEEIPVKEIPAGIL